MDSTKRPLDGEVVLKTITGFIALVLTIGWASVHAFASQDYATVDATTFRLYQDKQWDSLIVVGKQALKENIDYYFLRMRLGIAYYSKEKYIPASEHFRKAISFNSQEPAAWEYLYSSYTLANRTSEAKASVRKMPAEIRKKFSADKKFLELISFEGGPTFSSDNKKANDLDIKANNSPYAEQDLYGNSYYGKAGLLMNLTGSVSLTAEYSYMNFSKQKYYQYLQYDNRLLSRTDTSWGFINTYDFSPTLYNQEFPYHVNQHDFYLGSTIVLPGGFRIEPAFHLIYVKYNNITPVYTKTSVVDTIVFDSVYQGYNQFVSVQKENYSFVQKDTGFVNFVGSLGISKDFSVFNIRLSGSYSNLNSFRQIQAGLSLSYYPFGNLDFYGVSAVTGLSQKKEKRLILSQTFGGRILKPLWLEGNILYGNLTNANVDNASIVYNNADKIDYRIQGSLIWLIRGNVELTLTYQYFRKESSALYYVFNNPGPDVTTSREIKYSNYYTNSIFIGIKWKL